MIVDTEVPSGRLRKLRLTLDSGATSIVLMHRASQAVDPPAQATTVAVTSSGAVELQMATIQPLRVGSHQFRDVAVALTGIEAEERISDGLLPMALFQVLYINNRQGFVVLNPRRRKN